VTDWATEFMKGVVSCMYCKHDGPPHSTVMVQSTKHQRRCEGCPTCQAEIAAENEAKAKAGDEG
jgi:hypothetical protein